MMKKSNLCLEILIPLRDLYSSMTDMICALTAGLIVLYAVNRYYKHKKDNCLVNVCKNFYDKNFSE